MWMVCAVCGARLGVDESGPTDSYVHTAGDAAAGHAAVAVSEDALSDERSCFFCQAPPAATFPVDALALMSPTDAPTSGPPVAAWPACRECAALVENDHYDALVARAIAAVGKRHRHLSPDHRRQLRRAYVPTFDRFRRARRGAAVPLS